MVSRFLDRNFGRGVAEQVLDQGSAGEHAVDVLFVVDYHDSIESTRKYLLIHIDLMRKVLFDE